MASQSSLRSDRGLTASYFPTGETFEILIIGAGPAGASALASISVDASTLILDAENRLSDADANRIGKKAGECFSSASRWFTRGRAASPSGDKSLGAGKPAAGAGKPAAQAGKLCGGLLTLPAQRHIQALFGQLPDFVKVHPFKTRLECHDRNLDRFFTFPVPYANCDRKLLDEFLLGEALKKKRANYLPHTRVVRIAKEKGRWKLRVRCEREGWEGKIFARIVIDASGWRQVARRLLSKPLAPTLIALQVLYSLKSPPYPNYIAIFDSRLTPFFAWWIPKTYIEKSPQEGKICESYFAELGAGFPLNTRDAQGKSYPSEKNPRELIKLFADHLQKRGTELGEEVQVRGCPLVRIERAKDIWLGEDTLLVVGEAAGLISPSSGDGISYALASGISAGKSVSRFLKNHSGAYENNSQALVSNYRLALRPQLLELRLNIVKAKLLSSQRGRHVLSLLFQGALPFRVRNLPPCNKGSLAL